MDGSSHDGWCHLRVFEKRGASTIIVTEPCPHNQGRPLADSEDDLAQRVFAQLIPYARDYARDSFRWFEQSKVSKGQGEQFVELIFSSHDLSGGWIFI